MQNSDPHRTPPLAPSDPAQTHGDPVPSSNPDPLPTSEEANTPLSDDERQRFQDEIDGMKRTVEDLRGQLGRAYDSAAETARDNSGVLIGAAAVGGIIAGALVLGIANKRSNSRSRSFKRFQKEFERSAEVLADAVAKRLAVAGTAVAGGAALLGENASELAEDARDSAKSAAKSTRSAASDGWDKLEQVVRPIVAAAVVDKAQDWVKNLRN